MLVPVYAFTLIAEDSSSQLARVCEACSDDEACDIATEILLETDFPIIEVWRGKWMVYRLSRLDRG